uniref:DUF885 family protein n=1 Tax=Streptomyces sp. YIM 98790 TaxID=2689077 RepID=UPI00140744F2
MNGPAEDEEGRPRRIADRYLETMSDLDPAVAALQGNRPGDDRLPDWSPDGADAIAAAQRAALAELDAADAAGRAAGQEAAEERRAARLLRERLESDLRRHAAGDHLRDVNILFSPVQIVRHLFSVMPTETERDWAVLGARLRRVPEALRGYRA